MKRPFLLLFFATLLAGAPADRTLSARLMQGTTDERIKAYEKRLASSPDNVKVQSGLISAYLQKLRESSDYTYLDRAAKLTEKMLEREGGNFAALRFQNEIDLQRHNFQAVVESADDMTRYAPSDQGNWGNLGDALMELGEYERAGQAYWKMFALGPNLASYNRLAYFYFVTGDAERAIRFMRNAIASSNSLPENAAWCWAELGDIYFKTGKPTEAAAAYDAALKLFPALHRAVAGLGRVAAAQGKIKIAIENYRRAQSIVPLVEYAGALEDLYTAAGMSAEAREQKELIEAIEKLGRAANEKTNRNLALLLADHDRHLDTALNLMQAEIPIRGDVYTWDALSWALFKNGRTSEARAASLKALKLGTPEPVFYFHASKIAQSCGDEKAAGDYSKRLIALNEKFDFGKSEIASRVAP
ncbi:MAG TPA: tetratricopeptide repeat protein [Bryobacteraceae bacterium]|jgi:tetratricopeptide (TPR) repeat protein